MARQLYLFVAALFFCCANLDEGEASGNPIYASVGETAVLPCQTDNLKDLLTVEWSKNDKIALVYRDQRESYQDKDPYFKSRTSLVMKKPVEGNISLRISNVGLSDNGVFICKTIWKGVDVKEAEVELIVGAVSEPKLSVVPSEDGKVTLQCEANCWFPEPEITFLDDQGNVLKAQNPSRGQDSTGCVNVTRRVTLQTATNSVTCKVHQVETTQTRVTKTCIPANCLGCCTTSISIAALESAIICGLVAFLIYVKCYKPGRCKLLSRKSSDASTIIGITDRYCLRDEAEGIKRVITEQLGKLNALKLDRPDKEEFFRQITDELKRLRPEQSPAVSRHGELPDHDSPNPSTSSSRHRFLKSPENKDSKPVVQTQPSSSLTQRRNRYHSIDDADVSPTRPPASTSEEEPIVRSKSMSEPRPHPGAKPQRRYTVSTPSSNRFSVLEKLTEDSEQLLL